MKNWYPYIIGTIMFLYVQSYNRVARIYLESGKTLAWSDFFTKVVPLTSEQ
jgi:hypothetical protein